VVVRPGHQEVGVRIVLERLDDQGVREGVAGVEELVAIQDRRVDVGNGARL
jgi:hypothetical protein